MLMTCLMKASNLSEEEIPQVSNLIMLVVLSCKTLMTLQKLSINFKKWPKTLSKMMPLSISKVKRKTMINKSKNQLTELKSQESKRKTQIKQCTSSLLKLTRLNMRSSNMLNRLKRFKLRQVSWKLKQSSHQLKNMKLSLSHS